MDEARQPMERVDQILRIAPDCGCILEPGLDRMVVFHTHNRVISLDVLQSGTLFETQINEQLGIQICIGREGMEE